MARERNVMIGIEVRVPISIAEAKVGIYVSPEENVGSVASRKWTRFDIGKRNRFHQLFSCDSHLCIFNTLSPSLQVICSCLCSLKNLILMKEFFFVYTRKIMLTFVKTRKESGVSWEKEIVLENGGNQICISLILQQLMSSPLAKTTHRNITLVIGN